MTERTETLTQAAAPAHVLDGAYTDWPSILSGAVVTAAIAFVFSTFGAALGLSFASPYAGDGSPIAAVVAVGSWMLWTTISSFMVGGYIAGRMRRRVDAATADEVAVRDGIHGLTVWAAAILIGAIALGAAADTVLQAGAESVAAVAAVIDGATVATPTAANLSAAEVKAAAETARIYSVISAFALAASLMVAAAAAYWSAGLGGRHRDEGRAFKHFGRWA